jgi:glycosyltransferase involved in cell wall biosynthesis
MAWQGTAGEVVESATGSGLARALPTMPQAISRRPREKISAIVTTFNEEREIADCIRSLLWCDEILIVDSFSTDGTVEAVQAFPQVRLIQHTYYGSAAQKNWAMDRTSHEWILIFDADERCTAELRREIEGLLEYGAEHSSYRIRRRLFFLAAIRTAACTPT